MKEKILTREQVNELGLDKVSVITADMLEGYTSIGECAFFRCSSLTSITIPSSVTSIGYAAFSECSSLTSVTIPNSVISIGYGAFAYCRGLTSVTIGNSVTSIGEEAFESCSSLTSVTIPNSVISIGEWAFAYCSSLTSVTIPNSVTSIGGNAFRYCSSLTSVVWNAKNCSNSGSFGSQVESFVFGNEVETIPALCCDGMNKLSSIEIPNSVTRIGDYAFNRCSSLTSVTIPNSVTSIGWGAFVGCKLNSIERTDKQDRIIAYKGFNVDMTCRDFQYKEGETYEIEGEPILCELGFHACLNPMDCLNYYHGEIGKDVVFHEVYLEEMSNKKDIDSKVVAKKITIGREISLSEMADIASRRK